jgi:hypothetical protein
VAGGDDPAPVGWYPPVPDLPAGSERTQKGNPGSMNMYRKKPVVIEARQLSEDRDRTGELALWCGAHQIHFTYRNGTPLPHIDIATAEGTMTADPGDWIIKGVKGEFYPCKPDIFELTYDPVEESS